MSDVVIRVENLCKEYRLGTISHGTLYRDLQTGWAKFRGKEDPNARVELFSSNRTNNSNERFFALKDVSFDVEQGEVVGIIGKNGAGKSTLLKIISRVTAPTKGSIKIKGRVASLLEVGTGFHPELTGRENIFLNGAILGMHKHEIEQKFDEIVKFAEIEKFIDTPVKRYSSGMYVRLAFAVAAHLEPEILVVDEVLAVGDAGFQKKCLGKMGDVAKEGRTVLFVSHNMGAIGKICPSCILMKDGRLDEKGQTKNVIEHYLDSIKIQSGKSSHQLGENGDFQLINIRIIDHTGQENSRCNCDFPFTIEFCINMEKKFPGLFVYMVISTPAGEVIMISDSHDIEPNCLGDLDPGTHLFHAKMPARTLGTGNYYITLSFGVNFYIGTLYIDKPDFIYPFSVFDDKSDRGNTRGGYLSTLLKWEKCKDSTSFGRLSKL